MDALGYIAIISGVLGTIALYFIANSKNTKNIGKLR